MIWFILIATPTTTITPPARFPTHEACMIEATKRTQGMAANGFHGRYMCMFHNQPERSMAKYTTGEF
jgi:hypothetical protein